MCSRFFLFFICLLSCNKKIDYYNTPLLSPSGSYNAVIEIPAGTNKKYEFNKEAKAFEIDKKNGKDRIIQFLPYIGNYGFIPSTYSDPNKGGDGDALDILIISERVDTGTIMEIIPIAMLKLIDDGEIDYKIIGIPFDKNKQIIKANTFVEFSENFPEIKQIIELWFLSYNKDDVAEIEGWADEKTAILEINKNKF